MHDTHRFGAFVSLTIAGVALFISAAAEAGRLEEMLPREAVLPLATVSEMSVSAAAVPTLSAAGVGTNASAETVVPTELAEEPLVIPMSEPEVVAVASAPEVLKTPVPTPAVQFVPVTATPPPPVLPPTPAREVTERIPVPVAVVRPTASNASSEEEVFLRELEALIHVLTNEARQRAGLAILAYDDVLAHNARAYSDEMQAENFISHVNKAGCNMTCRFKADGYVAYYWGENLARWRSTYAPSVVEVAQYFVDEWQASDGHRDNLFSTDFTHEGIGASKDGNEIYVTVHFAEPK